MAVNKECLCKMSRCVFTQQYEIKAKLQYVIKCYLSFTVSTEFMYCTPSLHLCPGTTLQLDWQNCKLIVFPKSGFAWGQAEGFRSAVFTSNIRADTTNAWLEPILFIKVLALQIYHQTLLYCSKMKTTNVCSGYSFGLRLAINLANWIIIYTKKKNFFF